MPVLIVGGAGYIGAHMCLLLEEQGIDFVILDDFSSGWREFAKRSDFVEGRLDDHEILNALFASGAITAVLHFAANLDVGDSVRDPVGGHLKVYHPGTGQSVPPLGGLKLGSLVARVQGLLGGDRVCGRFPEGIEDST